MLEYRLDDLNWAEFEALCQALLKATLGVGVESWGGSGDWGIDACCQAPLRYPASEVQNGPFQFQVKFVHGANAAAAKPEGQSMKIRDKIRDDGNQTRRWRKVVRPISQQNQSGKAQAAGRTNLAIIPLHLGAGLEFDSPQARWCHP